jgi:L-malate glycosyltransferase
MIHMAKTNLKLAILTDTFAPWSSGGRESRFNELLPHLANEGLMITVYTMRWWDSPPPTQKIGTGYIRLRAICAPRPLYENGRRSLRHAFVFSLASLRLLFEDFDILETDSIPFFHLPVVWLVCKIRRRPLVIVWHEFWGSLYWDEYLGRLGPLGSWMERRSTHFGDVVIAVSKRTFQQLSDRGVSAERLVLAENVVRRVTGEVDESSPELLFVGRLIAHKRPDLALRALELLSDSSVRLCIVGTGPLKDELERQAVASGVSHQVTFIDNASDEDLGRLLYNARVLLSPSEREGFGLVVAEALSLGTPVITVDAPSNAAQELVIDGVSGRVCPSGDATSIAQAISALFEHPLDRGEVLRVWQELGVPTSYEQMAERLLLVYGRAAGAD